MNIARPRPPDSTGRYRRWSFGPAVLDERTLELAVRGDPVGGGGDGRRVEELGAQGPDLGLGAAHPEGAHGHPNHTAAREAATPKGIPFHLRVSSDAEGYRIPSAAHRYPKISTGSKRLNRRRRRTTTLWRPCPRWRHRHAFGA